MLVCDEIYTTPVTPIDKLMTVINTIAASVNRSLMGSAQEKCMFYGLRMTIRVLTLPLQGSMTHSLIPRLVGPFGELWGESSQVSPSH